MIVNHGAFEATHTCPAGRRPGSPSSVPRRTRRSSGSPSRRLYTGEPQRRQKARNFCGDDSYSAIRSSPETIWKYCVRTGAFDAKAEPEARRHCVQ